jgi:hypothetical protein
VVEVFEFSKSEAAGDVVYMYTTLDAVCQEPFSAGWSLVDALERVRWEWLSSVVLGGSWLLRRYDGDRFRRRGWLRGVSTGR